MQIREAQVVFASRTVVHRRRKITRLQLSRGIQWRQKKNPLRHSLSLHPLSLGPSTGGLPPWSASNLLSLPCAGGLSPRDPPSPKLLLPFLPELRPPRRSSLPDDPPSLSLVAASPLISSYSLPRRSNSPRGALPAPSPSRPTAVALGRPRAPYNVARRGATFAPRLSSSSTRKRGGASRLRRGAADLLLSAAPVICIRRQPRADPLLLHGLSLHLNLLLQGHYHRLLLLP
jgi:hypothetical protein